MSTFKELKERPLIMRKGIYGSGWWLLSDTGIPRDIFMTRRDAIAAAESNTGEPWSKCRAYMEVRKVDLAEYG